MEQPKMEVLNPKNEAHCECFRRMMHAYAAELGGMEEFAGKQGIDAFVEKWTDSILHLLGPADRHLVLCWLDNIPAGFLYGKVDHREHRGFVKPGCGYIMEFYVVPRFRRTGIGTAMFAHLEQCFLIDGAKKMYLTTDTDEGISFWRKMGFANTHEKSPDNQTEIYEKMIATSSDADNLACS